MYMYHHYNNVFNWALEGMVIEYCVLVIMLQYMKEVTKRGRKNRDINGIIDCRNCVYLR